MRRTILWVALVLASVNWACGEYRSSSPVTPEREIYEVTHVQGIGRFYDPEMRVVCYWRLGTSGPSASLSCASAGKDGGR